MVGHVVTEARVERSGGDAESAAELFDAALGLWRGPAFGEQARSTLVAEAAWLDELRLSVLEERAAAGLALGNYEALVDELTATVRQHPSREGLRRHLMVAALRARSAGRRARRLPGGAAGPGRRVRCRARSDVAGQHEAILRSEPAVLGIPDLPVRLALEPSGGPTTALFDGDAPSIARPAQFPAVPADFTGRGRQLAQVSAGLTL